MFQASIKELYDKVCAMTEVSQEKVCVFEVFHFCNIIVSYGDVFFSSHWHMYEQARIWDYFGKRKGQLLDPSSNKSLEESSLHMDQDVSI